MFFITRGQDRIQQRLTPDLPLDESTPLAAVRGFKERDPAESIRAALAVHPETTLLTGTRTHLAETRDLVRKAC